MSKYLIHLFTNYATLLHICIVNTKIIYNTQKRQISNLTSKYLKKKKSSRKITVKLKAETKIGFVVTVVIVMVVIAVKSDNRSLKCKYCYTIKEKRNSIGPHRGMLFVVCFLGDRLTKILLASTYYIKKKNRVHKWQHPKYSQNCSITLV